MTRILTILTFVLLIASNGFAQGKRHQYGKQREMIETQKISYLTQQLELTPKEAQNFWPLYNELQAKKEELQQERKQLMQKLRYSESTLSEPELSKASDRIVELQVEMAKLHQDYHYKFKKVLSVSKVLELYHAERQFQGMLLRRIKEGPHGRRGR